MLPWAATASPPRTPAAASFAPPLRAAAALPLSPLCCPLPRLLRAGLNSHRAPPLQSSDDDVFCEEPDYGSWSDYEDDGPEQRRASRFPSPSPSSRLRRWRSKNRPLESRNGIHFIATRWHCR